MDVVESVLCRLPPNWWWSFHPIDCKDSDYIFDLRGFPISHEFLLCALEDGGLMRRGGIDKQAFNSKFAGKLEIADCRRKGKKRTFYVRFCHKKKMMHKPEHQNEGTVQLSRPYVHEIRPEFRRIIVGRSTTADIVEFSERVNISCDNIPASFWDVNTGRDENITGEINWGVDGVGFNMDDLIDKAAREIDDEPVVAGSGSATFDEEVKRSARNVASASVLEKYGVEKRDERKLLRELVEKYTNYKGVLSTTSLHNNSIIHYMKIPTVSGRTEKTKKDRADLHLKSGFMDEIVLLFSNMCESRFCFQYIVEYFARNHLEQFIEGGRSAGLIIGSKLNAIETAAMWTESTVHQSSKQRVINSHLTAKFGTSLFSSQNILKLLRSTNPAADRASGVVKYRKVESITTKNTTKKEKITEKDVPFYVECPFQNTLLELQNRVNSGDEITGYTLGGNGNRFIVVNDGGDHGNIAFRQAITVLSKDKCTAGTVMITARILEHEDYDLFNRTISPVLNAGISRLQDTAFIVMKSVFGSQVIPVPYLAAKNTRHPMDRSQKLFHNQQSHSDFVVTGTDPTDQTTIIEGTLVLNEEGGLLSFFSWQYRLDGLVHTDIVHIQDTIRRIDVRSIQCYPTVVVGIGDIPYQAFMLGKLNMGSAHCNFCTCPSSMFGREDQCTFANLTQDDLVTVGTKKFEHNQAVKAGRLVGKFDGMQGITNPPYSRIPVELWMLSSLHMALGQICDCTNRMQRFIMARVFNYDDEEYLCLRDMAVTEKKLAIIQGQLHTYENARKYNYERSKNILDKKEKAAVLKVRNEMIKKMKDLQNEPATKLLKNTKEKLGITMKTIVINRDKLKTSAVYRFDTCLKKIGCDRNAFHKSSIDGNKCRVLMERREEFGKILFEEMTKCLLETKVVRDRILKGEHDEFGLATVCELRDEIQFMVHTLNLLNCIWPRIRGTRETILSLEEITNISTNINQLKEHWCCKRAWEKQSISVTPKWHLLFCHMVPVLTKYRRICHSAEDPIERTHAEDKHLERNFAHIRNPEHREDSKLKVRQFKRNPNINRKITEIKTKRKRNLKDTTVLRNQVKIELSKRVKLESRDGEKEFAL